MQSAGAGSIDLGSRRVLVGFAPDRVAARLDGDQLVADADAAVVIEGELRLPAAYMQDVVAEIAQRRAATAVLPGAVATSSIADATLNPATAFDPQADPLDVARGGTGLAEVRAGALLVGAGAAAAVVAPDVTFAADALSTPSLTVGTWRLATGTDALARRTVFATDAATGCNVDLLLAGRHQVRAPRLTATPGPVGSGQMTLEAAAPDDLVRVIHFDWRPAPSADLTPAQVARTPSKSVRVDPDGVARYTATGLPAGVSHDFRAAAEDGRGNVSEVTTAPGVTFDFIMSVRQVSSFETQLSEITQINPDVDWTLREEDMTYRIATENAPISVLFDGDESANTTSKRVKFRTNQINPGDRVFTLKGPPGSDLARFRIAYFYDDAAPGWRIDRNGVTVLNETENRGAAKQASPYTAEYL